MAENSFKEKNSDDEPKSFNIYGRPIVSFTPQSSSSTQFEKPNCSEKYSKSEEGSKSAAQTSSTSSSDESDADSFDEKLSKIAKELAVFKARARIHSESSDSTISGEGSIRYSSEESSTGSDTSSSDKSYESADSSDSEES